MSIIKSQRKLFNIPEEVAYFNSAANSPLLIESEKRLQEGVNSKCRPWERTPEEFFNDAEEIRVLSKELFGGDEDGYAITTAASYGISTAARIMEFILTKEDGILLLDEEFPSVVLPFKRVANESGAKIITVETPQDGNWTKAIENSIDKNIKVVAISACHWTNGAYVDLKKVRKLCDEVNAVLIVDATQMLGAMPFDIDEIQPDFLVAAGYKWLLCPYGFSLFYVDEKWRNKRPLEETWLARENAEDFANLVNYSDNYMKGSRRFDVGEKCIPTILPGAISALQQIKSWGIKNIAESLAAINHQIELHLSQLGFSLLAEPQRCPHMFGAFIPEGFSGDLVGELRKEKIFISQRGKSLRFAPHLHINDNDIDRLLDNLKLIMNNNRNVLNKDHFFEETRG